jgi:pimeloyl-ACP methyl ester carboxylesterase
MGKREGKVAVIIGGNTGIGLATTQRFDGRSGRPVHGTEQDPERLERVMNRRKFHIASLLAWSGSRGVDWGTFLLVHGAWHSAMHWHAVAAILAGRGCRVLTIDLPGHGLKAKFPEAYLRQDLAALATEPSPLKDVSLDDYVAAVVTAARGLAQYGPMTVVGHSMGGLAITRAAEAIPELINRLVYLTAFCPIRLPNLLGYDNLPENAGVRKGPRIGDPKQTGALRTNPRSNDRSRAHRGYPADLL